MFVSVRLYTATTRLIIVHRATKTPSAMSLEPVVWLLKNWWLLLFKQQMNCSGFYDHLHVLHTRYVHNHKQPSTNTKYTLIHISSGPFFYMSSSWPCWFTFKLLTQTNTYYPWNPINLIQYNVITWTIAWGLCNLYDHDPVSTSH